MGGGGVAGGRGAMVFWGKICFRHVPEVLGADHFTLGVGGGGGVREVGAMVFWGEICFRIQEDTGKIVCCL